MKKPKVNLAENPFLNGGQILDKTKASVLNAASYGALPLPLGVSNKQKEIK